MAPVVVTRDRRGCGRWTLTCDAPGHAAVGGRRLATRARRTPLARLLLLAVTALLVPLIVVTVVGVAMFRSSIGSLEAFRRDTIEATAQVDVASELMALADDVGEQYVEDGDEVSGLAPHDLVVELTEGSLVQDLDLAAGELQQLRDLGVRIALDDFGTGYSSISHLLRFPVDIIKIDRSFVAAIGTNDQGTDLAAALVALGRTMGLQTVAESIAEAHQLSLLQSLHCELGQGYLFTGPLGADEVGKLLRRSLTPTGG